MTKITMRALKRGAAAVLLLAFTSASTAQEQDTGDLRGTISPENTQNLGGFGPQNTEGCADSLLNGMEYEELKQPENTRTLQACLFMSGRLSGDDIDGDFGPKTGEAVLGYVLDHAHPEAFGIFESMNVMSVASDFLTPEEMLAFASVQSQRINKHIQYMEEEAEDLAVKSYIHCVRAEMPISGLSMSDVFVVATEGHIQDLAPETCKTYLSNLSEDAISYAFEEANNNVILDMSEYMQRGDQRFLDEYMKRTPEIPAGLKMPPEYFRPL